MENDYVVNQQNHMVEDLVWILKDNGILLCQVLNPNVINQAVSSNKVIILANDDGLRLFNYLRGQSASRAQATKQLSRPSSVGGTSMSANVQPEGQQTNRPRPRAGTCFGSWEVGVVADDIDLSEVPEPVIGLNYARDQLRRKNWLSLVAAHSDSWLMAVAFFLAYGCDSLITAHPERAPITCETRFRIFMDKLMRNVSSIQFIKLTCQKVNEGKLIGEAALCRNLKNLELGVGFLWRPFYLVDKLCGCGLQSLNLCIEDADYIHQYRFSLPNLKQLRVHLTNFEIVNPLIEGCPLLESSVVSNCCIKVPSLKALRISNAFPSLESFFYRGLLDESYLLKRLKSLGSVSL